MAAPSIYERRGRARKVAALCRFIDGNCLRRGLSPAAGAAHVVDLLTNVWTAAHWAQATARAAKLAGLRFNAASPETQIAVIDVYRQRALRSGGRAA